MLVIEYDGLTGTPVADGMCEEMILDMYCRGFTHFKTGTENMILATRALICGGVLPHTEVQFKFRDQIIQPNRDGRCLEWPNGFCDKSEDWLLRLLKGRSNEANVSKAVQS